MSLFKSSNRPNPPVTIFVVDDEPMLLDLAKVILEPLGLNVRIYRDPKLALKEFPESKPAVVVTDYAMAGMNGLDLLRECKRLNPQLKTMLLSGTVDEHTYPDNPIQPDCFLAKPYQIRDLVEVVRKLAAGG